MNLSGRIIDDELVKALEVADSLQHLILHDSEIDAKSLQRLLASNPELYVELGRRPEFMNDELAADLRRRGLALRSGFGTGWRQLFLAESESRRGSAGDREQRDRQNPRQVVSLSIPFSGGRIDPELFRPKPVGDQSIE